MKTMAAIGVKKSCFWSPWQQSCWSHYRFHTVCNREVFQRAPFIVQITNGAFMPPDKWQMIIYPDTAEHICQTGTHATNTLYMCVCPCVCTAKVHLCICNYWQLPHLEEVMLFVPWAGLMICDDIYAWWNFYASAPWCFQAVCPSVPFSWISQKCLERISLNIYLVSRTNWLHFCGQTSVFCKNTFFGHYSTP